MTDVPIQRTFLFKRRLGTGTFGEVYEAVLQSPGGLEKRVAVKLLKADVAHDRDAVSRLRDEGRILSNLDHPNILAVVDLVDIGARRALVMEFVDGEDLGNLLRRQDIRIPMRVFLEIGAQVARALDAAWSTPLPGSDVPAHLIHRDVKPQNIRISKHGVVKLLDFGIARSDDVDREARTETAVVVGSVPFMAPESFLQEAPGHPIDVFSLGCVLFEALSGERFYRGVKRQRVFQLLADPVGFEAHLEQRATKIAGSHDVAAVVRRCLSWNPQERPSARELAVALERHADATPGPNLVQWCRDHTWSEGDGAGEPGGLEGMSLTEGGIAAGSIRRPVVRLRGRGWQGALFGVGLLGAFGLLCAGVSVGRSRAGSGDVRTPIEPAPLPRAAPVIVPTSVPEPAVPVVSEPVVPPPSLVAPSPVVPSPAPKPKPTPPRPDPEPVVPAPAPAPAGSLEVYFQNREGVKFTPDQDLPPDTYRIIANFGDGFQRVGSAEVQPGQEVRLSCSPARKTCSVK